MTHSYLYLGDSKPTNRTTSCRPTIYMYIYIYTYVCTHTHTHIHIYIDDAFICVFMWQ